MRGQGNVIGCIAGVRPPPASPEHGVSEREHIVRRYPADACIHFLVLFAGLPVVLAVASIRCWRVDSRTLHVREGIGLLVES